LLSQTGTLEQSARHGRAWQCAVARDASNRMGVHSCEDLSRSR
jgi:hypothetical protein